MELTPEQYNAIQDYLDLSMSPQSVALFENELGKNPLLRENLEFEQELRNHLMNTGQEDKPGNNLFQDSVYIKNLIDKAGQDFDINAGYVSSNNRDDLPENGVNENQHSHRQVSRRISYKTIYALAAVLIAIVIIGIILVTRPAPGPVIVDKGRDTPVIKKDDTSHLPHRQTGPPNDATLAGFFKQYFKKDTSPQEKPQYLADALDDFDRGQYTGIRELDLHSIPNLRGGPVDSKQNVLELAHYYRGLSYIESKVPGEAATNLLWITTHGKNPQLVVKAQWYLALVYLQETKIPEARKMLHLVVENDKGHLYKENAETLLKALTY